ncbi:MAG: glycosyltransferase family 4 protein, partial [Thermosphaera sp.]
DKSSLSLVKKDVRLELLLPLIGYPYTIGLLLEVFYGLIFTILAVFKRPKLIYVRTSGLALFPVAFKRIHKAKVIVKIPSLLEEELKGVGDIKVHMCDYKAFEIILRVLERYIIFKADRVAIPSLQFYRELCKRRLIKSRNPPLIVPPGIDLTKIERIRKTDETNYSNSHGEITIGYVGLLEWWQGVDMLVKAVGTLQREAKTKFKLLIVGDGPTRKKIEKLCRELDVRCEFTGFIPHEDALKMMKKMKVLVVPRFRSATTETNIPIKVIEAWAMGVPIIITKHRIFLDIEKSTEMPVLMCEPEPRSVANAITAVISDRSFVERLVSIGSLVAKEFDYNRIAKKIVRVVAEELNNQTDSPIMEMRMMGSIR